MHKTFVAQAGARTEEPRLLIKRQEELEEEKRVAEEKSDIYFQGRHFGHLCN